MKDLWRLQSRQQEKIQNAEIAHRHSRDGTMHSEVTANGIETGKASGGSRGRAGVNVGGTEIFRNGVTETLTLSRGTDTIRHRPMRFSFF